MLQRRIAHTPARRQVAVQIGTHCRAALQGGMPAAAAAAEGAAEGKAPGSSQHNQSPDVRSPRQEAQMAQRRDKVGQGEAAQAGQLRQVQQPSVSNCGMLQHDFLWQAAGE